MEFSKAIKLAIDRSEKTQELQATIARIHHFATGGCKLSDVDRILCIAKECEAEEFKSQTGG